MVSRPSRSVGVWHYKEQPVRAGGTGRNRTGGLVIPNHARCQLRYCPISPPGRLTPAGCLSMLSAEDRLGDSHLAGRACVLEGGMGFEPAPFRANQPDALPFKLPSHMRRPSAPRVRAAIQLYRGGGDRTRLLMGRRTDPSLVPERSSAEQAPRPRWDAAYYGNAAQMPLEIILISPVNRCRMNSE